MEYHGVGRRKTAIARVYLRSGSSKDLVVNKKKLDDYFPIDYHRHAVHAPLACVDAHNQFSIYVNVKGGGVSSQAGAVQLGIARALAKINEGYHALLREQKFLTRDHRMVERKKYGQKGARKKFQFSKR